MSSVPLQLRGHDTGQIILPVDDRLIVIAGAATMVLRLGNAVEATPAALPLDPQP